MGAPRMGAPRMGALRAYSAEYRGPQGAEGPVLTEYRRVPRTQPSTAGLKPRKQTNQKKQKGTKENTLKKKNTFLRKKGALKAHLGSVFTFHEDPQNQTDARLLRCVR